MQSTMNKKKTLVFFYDSRFFRARDGNIYNVGTFRRTLWERYLTSFDEIVVVARFDGEREEGDPALLCTIPHVRFVALPTYRGLFQFLRAASKIRKIISEICVPGSSFICRLPSHAGRVAAEFLKRRRIPYAVEVVADPWDVFAPRSTTYNLAPLYRLWGYISLRKAVHGAAAALYVTQNALQRRYPPNINSYSVGISDVELSEETFSLHPKMLKDPPFTLLCIGSLAQMYKAPDVVLHAFRMLRESGILAKLVWCGGGRHLRDMENLALRLGIAEYCCFCGNVPPLEVRRQIDAADVYVHVSRMDGLPRALAEAMARGLPCVGSDIGGIPELLDSCFIVPKNNPKATCEKIRLLLENRKLYSDQSSRNLEKARTLVFNSSALRREFYEKVKGFVSL